MKVYGYTHDDFEKDNDVALAMAGALFGLIGKLKNEGTEDCQEYDRGITALRHFWARQNEAITKVEELIKKVDSK